MIEIKIPLDQNTKPCGRCHVEKPVTQFHKASRAKDGLYCYCKKCSIEQSIAWRKLHRERSNESQRNWRHRTGRHGLMSKNKSCSIYLGIWVAERALSTFFDRIQKAPYGKTGFDFICNRGAKVDVKSSCLYVYPHNSSSHWSFDIRRNVIADYFLCLAFDNRESLNPQHVWLVPSKKVSAFASLKISNSQRGLAKWKEFERPLDKVITCCNLMRVEEPQAVAWEGLRSTDRTESRQR